MKKNRLAILAIATTLVIGGTIMTVQNKSLFTESMEVSQVGNGTPQGGGYMLTLRGKVNNNDKTKFMIGLSLDNDANSIPKELGIYEMQPIRIYRDGGWYYYDEK